MITANSRHDTGQFCKDKARTRAGLTAVVVFAPLSISLTRGVVLVPSWLPIVHIPAAIRCFASF